MSVSAVQYTFNHVKQFFPSGAAFHCSERRTESKCTSEMSSTRLTHIHTHILVQGRREADRRKLQERSAWANGRGSLHHITPDTFDRSFNVTTQPLTPTSDVTGKPGCVCCTWTRTSVCTCACWLSASPFTWRAVWKYATFSFSGNQTGCPAPRLLIWNYQCVLIRAITHADV